MTQFQEVLTGKRIQVDIMNTRITKTSLFDEKQEGARYRPGAELSRRGVWLAYSGPKANMEPSKRTPIRL